MTKPTKAPFPYFGAKTRAATEIWRRIGSVRTYVEPFAGSAAVFLAQPPDVHVGMHVLNDANGFVANVWRAIKHDPEAVAAHADWPAFEIDMRARELALRAAEDDLLDALKKDPDYFSAKLAGWWVWGQSVSIMGDWMTGRNPSTSKPSGGPSGVHSRDGMQRIHDASKRLATARVLCGDWSRVVTNASMRLYGAAKAGVVLDPPYGDASRHKECYGKHDSITVSNDVREWAIEHGTDPRLRIALCGYAGEHDMPSDWSFYSWSTGSAVNRGSGVQNGDRERVWFSPHCLR